jgi:uncharacterized protein (TIGR03000 family)
MNNLPQLGIAAILCFAMPSFADAQVFRRMPPAPRPAPQVPSRPIDTSWQKSPYLYWQIHHHRPLPPYPPYRPWPYPYPIPYPYPVPYPYPYDPANTYVNNYYQPPADSGLGYNPPTTTALPPPKSNQAVICVVLPTTAAVVWVDGEKKESGLSSTRVFTTPDLEPGHNYYYTIKAQWVQVGENVSQERLAVVSAGKTTVVDFTKASGAK